MAGIQYANKEDSCIMLDTLGKTEIHNITQATKSWDERLQGMCFRNFAEPEQYVMANPIPEMEAIDIDDVVLDSEKSHLDFIALRHLPTDAPDGYAPVKIHGDGNCFP